MSASERPPDVLSTVLPGPDRKRAESPYTYRMLYRNADAEAVGCLLLWEVAGGRLPYQIVLEKDPKGRLQLHCTCADAVYRAEEQGRYCKHVRGLLQFGLAPGASVDALQPCARLGA